MTKVIIERHWWAIFPIKKIGGTWSYMLSVYEVYCKFEVENCASESENLCLI